MSMRLLGMGLVGLAALPSFAWAQDADGDGVADAADAFPCDPSRASVTYFPAQNGSALLTFEDQWPGATDLDFNDVVVRAHYRLERNAAGQVVQLHAVFDPVALGGELSNGLGLALPTARHGVSARRRVGGGAWQALALESDPEVTLVLSPNLRELYGDALGRINALPGQPLQSGQRLELEVSFTPPAALSAAAAPFDVFIFRAGDLSRQIHFPQFAGTAAMNVGLFGSEQDGSTPSRRFVHISGVPAALNLMTTTRYPLEGVGIAALFPDILGFASSGGTQNTGFYQSNVVTTQGHHVPALALPEVPAPSTACLSLPTCRAIRLAQPTAPSGTYTVDPDGAEGPVAPLAAYCDMTTDGGGWTLLEVGRASGVNLRTRNGVGTVTDPAQVTSAKLPRSVAAAVALAGDRMIRLGSPSYGYLFLGPLDPSWVTQGLGATGFGTVVVPHSVSLTPGGVTYAGSRIAWPLDGMPAACSNSGGGASECGGGPHLGTWWSHLGLADRGDNIYVNSSPLCCNLSQFNAYTVWAR